LHQHIPRGRQDLPNGLKGLAIGPQQQSIDPLGGCGQPVIVRRRRRCFNPWLYLRPWVNLGIRVDLDIRIHLGIRVDFDLWANLWVNLWANLWVNLKLRVALNLWLGDGLSLGPWRWQY
jgi:hypothetical protein